ncbi:hypothetical protein MMC32_001706 [Xylographa parallela]|nr:hypothetical protein [Xylographa parallela]
MLDAAFTSSGIKPYAFVPIQVQWYSSVRRSLDLIPLIPRLTTILKPPLLTPNLLKNYGTSPNTYFFILDEFSYFFETAYNTTVPTFPQCAIDSPPGAFAAGRMYIINHFLEPLHLRHPHPGQRGKQVDEYRSGEWEYRLPGGHL